jgi:uncharacterized protein DUF3311
VNKRKAYWLLVVPFVATLLPFLYNRAEPALFGMPFFYWYQLAWVLITGGLLGLVVYLTRDAGAPGGSADGGDAEPKAERRLK